MTLLLQKGYRSLPVGAENGRLLGIITDGDLLRRADLSTRLDASAGDWAQRLLAVSDPAITAASLMTAPVVTVPATAVLRQAMQQMSAHDLKRLPVVDNGRLAGWVSRIDILRALDLHQSQDEPLTYEREGGAVERHAATIADLMYQDVPVVQPGATLEAVLQTLEQDRRRRAVVVDDNRQVLGIITDGDLLQRSQHAAHPGFLARLRYLVTGQAVEAAFGGATTETAVDLMTNPVITISLQATPEEALRLVLQHEVKRLPVVDENGRLVGLLSRASLLRGLLGNVDASAATNR